MTNNTARSLDWTEQGYVPDVVIRHGIRRLLKQRLQEIQAEDCEAMSRTQQQFLDQMRQGDIAPLAHKANEQHYEVPAAFFHEVLGPYHKYSSCHWLPETQSLAEAERSALMITCERAQLHDGQKILELGCGWGSLTLWMAKYYPASQITAVSNSHSQREYILTQAKQQGLNNVNIITCDMNEFNIDKKFDRVVSVEMFEHMRNWPFLFKKISHWLHEDGKFFMHIFCHRSASYAFEDNGPGDWMSRHFFSGGMMPSDDLPLFVQEHLQLEQRWRWNGKHYEKTANAWLENMDKHKARLWPILQNTYGQAATQQWWMRWRMFFMACAELFGYDNGQQWWVSHYLFNKQAL